MHQEDFSGHITPGQAHAWQQSGEGVIIDVRTEAERTWVGEVPGAIGLSWKEWPGMQPNPGFDAAIRAIAAQHAGQKLLFLCRSGVRSVAAAQRAAELGLEEGRITFTVLESSDPGAALIDYATNNHVDHILMGARHLINRLKALRQQGKSAD